LNPLDFIWGNVRSLSQAPSKTEDVAELKHMRTIDRAVKEF